MNEQLKKMGEGGGCALFPRPISQSPELPVAVTHTLNACPVCCLWYSCWDYVPASCGHCYHPWCLCEHALRSDKCIVVGCEAVFLAAHKNALGLRPVGIASGGVIPKLEGRFGKGVAVVAAHSRLLESVNLRGSVEDVPFTQLFQSSETGNVEIMRGLCLKCKKRPAAVILKVCGHASYYFRCIQGCVFCPTCEKKIDGWAPLSKNLGVTPLPRPDCAPEAAASDVRVEKPSNATVPLALPQGGADYEGGDSDDGDDEGVGVTHWCGDDDFARGARRSVSQELQGGEDVSLGAGDEILIVQEREAPLLSRTLLRRSSVLELHVAAGTEAHEEIALVTKKKQSRALLDCNNLNHTRIVERALDEICAVAPALHGVAITLGKATVTATPALEKKRGPGRPSKASKADQPVNRKSSDSAGANSEPQRSRREKGARETVPFKFRGLEGL